MVTMTATVRAAAMWAAGMTAAVNRVTAQAIERVVVMT